MTALRAIRVLGSPRLAISAVLLATFLVTVPKVEALDKAPVKIATSAVRSVIWPATAPTHTAAEGMAVATGAVTVAMAGMTTGPASLVVVGATCLEIV